MRTSTSVPCGITLSDGGFERTPRPTTATAIRANPPAGTHTARSQPPSLKVMPHDTTPVSRDFRSGSAALRLRRRNRPRPRSAAQRERLATTSTSVPCGITLSDGGIERTQRPTTATAIRASPPAGTHTARSRPPSLKVMPHDTTAAPRANRSGSAALRLRRRNRPRPRSAAQREPLGEDFDECAVWHHFE